MSILIYKHNIRDKTMEKTMLTPEDSLLLITKTIEETKQRFKENGHLIIFWGVLMFIVTLSQYILIRLELYEIHWYPNFLYPLGAIYTFIYGWKAYKKNNLPKTIIGNILWAMAWLLGVNFMILGFFFSHKLGEVIAPVFLIFLALFVFTSGISIKFKPLIIGGIILNLIAFTAFFIDFQYHPLIMSIGSVIALIIPGILLNKENKKENV